MRFIHQLKGWPCLRWDAAEIEDELSAASFELGKFSGRLNAIGFNLQQEARDFLASADKRLRTGRLRL